MTDLTADHPAVTRCFPDGKVTDQHIIMAETFAEVIREALPHLTADDLRNTPAGRALMAEGKSLGWDDAIGELRKGQGMHRALAGTLSTRKPNYEETPNE